MRFARPAEGAESASSRKDRETANNAILSASEAYINAHRGGLDFSEAQDVYLPDLREAEAAMNFANQNFVDARQRVEQHGVKPVLDATLAIEEAVNQGDYDKAAQIRRDRLVPAVRENMDRPTSGPW